MRKITIFVSILAVLFVLAGAAAAQPPEKILKQAAKSLGGDKALKAINSTQSKGRIIDLASGADGSYMSQVSAPNLYLVSYDLGGPENSAGYNGRSGWQRDSRNGVKTLTGDLGRDFQAEAAFHASRWFSYKLDKSKLSPAGSKVIYGKNCNGVNLTTFKGVRIAMYFDAATGLPVREEFPNGGTVKTLDYEDFRKVDNVLEPFRIIVSLGEEKYDIKLDEVSHDRPPARAGFDFPKVSNQPLPDIANLLKEVQANQDRVEEILEDYTYNSTTSIRDSGRDSGKDGGQQEAFSFTHQITFYKGNRIYRTIEKNGKPLTEKEQEKEDKQVADRIADLEKKIVKQEKKSDPDEDDQKVSLSEMLRASNLINPRRESFRGRDVIVFDFEPNSSFDYKNAKSILKFFGKTAGVIWVDEKDKQIARMEAALVDSFSVVGGMVKLRKGASFSMEQDRINNEIWLPVAQDINISARVFLVKGMSINQTTRYGNYKKFKTDVKDELCIKTPEACPQVKPL
jgi:hypothetical protein